MLLPEGIILLAVDDDGISFAEMGIPCLNWKFWLITLTLVALAVALVVIK
jgi:hypothetical protein